MTKNKISDLNDHLFAQLERLADEDLTADEIAKEVARSEAIAAVSDRITESARLRLQAAKLYAEHGAHILPRLAAAKKGIAYDTAPAKLKPTLLTIARLEHAARERRSEREKEMRG